MPKTILPRQAREANPPPKSPPPTPKGEPRDGSLLLYTRPECEAIYWLYVPDAAARDIFAGRQKPLPFWIECEHKHGPAHPRMAIRCSVHEAPLLVKELPFVTAGVKKRHPLFTGLPRMDHHKYAFRGGMTWDRFAQDVQKPTPSIFTQEKTPTPEGANTP